MKDFHTGNDSCGWPGNFQCSSSDRHVQFASTIQTMNQGLSTACNAILFCGTARRFEITVLQVRHARSQAAFLCGIVSPTILAADHSFRLRNEYSLRLAADYGICSVADCSFCLGAVFKILLFVCKRGFAKRT